MSLIDSRAPVAPLDMTADAFLRDPIGHYRQIRDVGRLVYVPGAHAFITTRYRDGAAALREPKLTAFHYQQSWRKIAKAAGRDHSPVFLLLSYMPFSHEGDRHRELRATLAQGVAPVAAGGPALDAGIAGKAERLRSDGGFDLVGDFAQYLLFDAMCDMMEVPTDERSHIRPIATMSWAIETTISVRQRDLLADTTRRVMEYLKPHVAATMAKSANGFFRGIHDGLPAHEEDKITAVAMLATVMLVMGNDAVGSCVSTGVRRLLDAERPVATPQSEWASLSDDAIRYAAPVDYTIREASEDMTVAGCPVMKGEYVFSSMLSANHDPEQYGALADTITSRKDVGLAFGAGRHLCVGNRLTRTVVKSALAALAALPRLRLVGEATHGTGKVVRTLTSLPVEFV